MICIQCKTNIPLTEEEIDYIEANLENFVCDNCRFQEEQNYLDYLESLDNHKAWDEHYD